MQLHGSRQFSLSNNPGPPDAPLPARLTAICAVISLAALPMQARGGSTRRITDLDSMSPLATEKEPALCRVITIMR
jgi:hypothetical protein